MQLNSLDPRVNRLPSPGDAGMSAKAPMDQFGTFEVFVQPRAGKPFQHEGAVHAPDIELAFVLAKETFTRRFTCSSLFVADTRHVFVSAMTEGDQSVYQLIREDMDPSTAGGHVFEIFHLNKRGKQHVHAGQVRAADAQDAFLQAKLSLTGSSVVYNVWAIRTDQIRFTREDENDLWNTLPDKKFRDASAYKAGEKLNAFLQKS